jgi:eukaryotic-like serine/threonine-protein kinase
MTTPRLLSERYELGEALGYGGMSEVHRGFDTRLGRDVAVKVLRADLARDPQFQLRFRREAQNAAALNHPAIVAVYDTGEVESEFGSLPYIVMEYVDGQTLRDIVKTEGPLPQRRVIEVMADVCAALDFSHRHNIIHRDVKPANVMINRAGAVKVMDFGIARALGEGQNVTQTAAVIGTAQYLSPEQARGEAVDARSDVYAAGCVLFELLTGEPPFTGDTPVAVAYQHVREDPRRPSEVNPSVPPELDAVVLKALSKNPLNRYQSAAEMRSDLVRVRNGQPPMAPAVMSEDERTALLAASTAATRRINGRRTAPPPAEAVWEDEPPRRGMRTALIVTGVVAALVLLAFVGFQLLRGSPARAEVAVPNLVGQEENAARTALIEADLRPDVQQIESSVEESGRVVSTVPPSGTNVETRSTVILQIGGGPAQAAVPPLIGKTVDEAEQLLRDRGLTLGEPSEEPTADRNLVGKIIRSTPGAGENAPGGSAVAVVVGAEQQLETVPDVIDQDPDDAQARMEAAGFRVERVGSGDQVSATNPQPGQQAPRGSTVTIQLSDGELRAVPRVIGDTEADARDKLNDAGFNEIQTAETITTDETENDVVLRQDPGPGQRADPAQPVRLLIGRFPGADDG